MALWSYDTIRSATATAIALSALPSYRPTVLPSYRPTVLPSYRPTVLPSYRPTVLPSYRPTVLPSYRPTVLPSYRPTAVLPEFVRNSRVRRSWLAVPTGTNAGYRGRVPEVPATTGCTWNASQMVVWRSSTWPRVWCGGMTTNCS